MFRRLRFWNSAAPSRISRWPGSPSTCRSGTTPTASIIWTAFAAPGWIDPSAIPPNRLQGGQYVQNSAMLDRRDLEPVFFAPFVSSLMKVEPAWIDYNGHLNMAYYNVLFDRAVDEVFELLGCGADYVKKGFSTFTAEVHVRYLRELKEGDPVRVTFHCSITTRSACTISSSFFTPRRAGCRRLRRTCRCMSTWRQRRRRRSRPR